MPVNYSRIERELDELDILIPSGQQIWKLLPSAICIIFSPEPVPGSGGLCNLRGGYSCLFFPVVHHACRVPGSHSEGVSC